MPEKSAGRRYDVPHMRRVTAVLDVLIADGADAPHALVALQDANVACSMALTLGLTLKQARAQMPDRAE